MTTAETRINTLEVPLAELEVPLCEKCNGDMELQSVGICANPTKGMVPTWTVLKPICTKCEHICMDWLDGRMLFPHSDKVAWEFLAASDVVKGDEK